MNKAYEPKEVEDKIYRLWEKSGFFNPDKLPKRHKKPYTIVIPPPNVTGELHIGHALNAVIQDSLIRWKRMKGFKTLWLPGTDHAGIATQNVVEKKLRKENISRFDLGQEKFIEEVWKWKEQYGNIILNQFKRLGSSCDWSRTRFTMDKGYSEAVKETFIHYYNNGWIYRGKRVINWCPRCGTSLSDLELEHKEEKSNLWFIKYPIKGADNFIVVATTRPETMLGDTAVAINPKNQRYKSLVGKTAVLPLTNREIPIISDRLVDLEFGTGAVKVTPAHDLTDYQIGQTHNLKSVQVIGERGEITSEAPEKYRGLKVKEAREKIVEDLTVLGLIEKIEEYAHQVPKCYRCNSTVELIPSWQWFVKMAEPAKLAERAVKNGEIKFHPKSFEKPYLDWLKNIRDWCVSRQIWWGHRVPVWICQAGKNPNGQAQTAEEEGAKKWDLKIYGEDIFNGIKSGMKSIEVRAGKPKGAEKYWGDFKIGDEITFSLANEKTDKLVAGEAPIKKIVKKTAHFKNFKEFFKNYEAEMDYPGKNNKQVEAWWKNHPAMYQRIKKYGLWVFELADNVEEIFYVGDKPPKGYKQSNDVLDTWFSSALWPFATLGWPDKKAKDLKNFYPTDTLSTARDIINLWVARMIFSGKEFTGKNPFKDVYIHATVLTKDGQRMSKSLGTGINPLQLIDEYGADAARFGIAYQITQNQDIKFILDNIMMGKKFANKIWNASRFVAQQAANSKLPPLPRLEKNFAKTSKIKNLTKEDKKILKALSRTILAVDKNFDNFEFGKAAHNLYDFFWHDFCDIYIEASKKQNDEKTKQILAHVLLNSLKMLHPFMPFITEEIYQKLPIKDKMKSIMVEIWPKP